MLRPLVSRRARPPAAGTDHRSSSLEKNSVVTTDRWPAVVAVVTHRSSPFVETSIVASFNYNGKCSPQIARKLLGFLQPQPAMAEINQHRLQHPRQQHDGQ